MSAQEIQKPSNTEASVDLLGVSEVDPDIAEQYENRRQLVAINIAGELMTKDAEYARLQGIANSQYLAELLDGLPHITLGFKAKDSKRSGMQRRREILVTDLSASVPFRPAKGENGVSGERMADASSVRAATIWITGDADNQVVLQPGDKKRYSITETLSSEIALPYVLIGHRSLNGRGTEVLLMSLIPQLSISYVGPYLGGEPAQIFSISKNADEYDHWVFPHWDNQLLRAQMPDDQYEKLITMQETLFDIGLRDSEVSSAHNVSTGTLSLNANTVDTVKARLVKGNHIPIGHKPPKTASDVSSKAFSLTHTRFGNSQLNPVDFLEFNVLQDTHRTAAMLGREKAFESAKEHLIEHSPRVPDIILGDQTS